MVYRFSRKCYLLLSLGVLLLILSVPFFLNSLNLIQEEESDCKTCHTSIRLYHPEEADCSNCHADHSSGSPKLLLDKIPALCWNCHEENVKMESKHFPFSEGECLECHVAHGNKEDYFLAESLPNICLECHGEINELMERNFVHPPVEEDCTTCHSPHSSDFPKLLKDFISLRFYELYTPLKYQLCFQCHDRKDIFGSNSGFVKGDINLHKVHVQKRKGRTCFVCHDPHASDQGYLLRERIPFGKFWFIKLKLEEKNGQKSCLPSCHQKENYGK